MKLSLIGPDCGCGAAALTSRNGNQRPFAIDAGCRAVVAHGLRGTYCFQTLSIPQATAVVFTPAFLWQDWQTETGLPTFAIRVRS